MPTTRLNLLVLSAIGALLLVVIALAVIFVTMRQPQRPAATGQIAITITSSACAPNDVTVVAGTPDFAIHNASDRAIEWEILNGVMVVAERENIVPGFTAELTPHLDPGTYQMTCGLLSNPRGTLTVTATDGTTTIAAAAPTLADLVAPTAEYRVYAIKSADSLTTATTALAASVKSGDLIAAKTYAANAVAAFAQIAPVTHLFGATATALSTGPASLTGLAKALGTASSADGLATAADAAAAGAVTLGTSVHMTTAAPHEIVAGAGAVVTTLSGGFDDVPAATAIIAGVRKVADLFKPLTLRADKALANKLDADLTTVEAALAAPGAIATPALKAQLTDLGSDFTDLLAALGLNAPQGG